MVRYFEKDLKPSIKAKIDQDVSHLDNYEELIAKAVRADAKVSLQPSFYIRETDQQVPQRNQLAHTNIQKIEIQEVMKDHYEDKSKTKAFAPTSTQNSEPSDKARKNKKKKQHKAEQEDSTLVNRVNVAQTGEPRQKRKKLRDLSMVTCFNYDKKAHYANIVPISQITSFGLNNLLIGDWDWQRGWCAFAKDTVCRLSNSVEEQGSSGFNWLR